MNDQIAHAETNGTHVTLERQTGKLLVVVWDTGTDNPVWAGTQMQAAALIGQLQDAVAAIDRNEPKTA